MPARVKKTKKKRRMTGLLACLGGCGGKVPRDDIEEITTLDYRHFSLTEVPSDVFACERTLETLYLDSNQISELPRELFLCHGLRHLSVSDNELSSVPQAVASLQAIASLDISKNNLSSIPDSIKACRELASVDVSVNPLCKLPEGFTQLIALKELFLNDTFLEYLPANFGRLVSLEVLELRENQLNTLPKSLARLTKLRTLDIGNNEFSQLPEVIGSLSSLEELWFDSNRVRNLAPFLGQLEELTYLEGSNNRIDGLPDEISRCKKLTDLHLTGNYLKALPDSLSKCSSLQILRVDDNALSSLPSDLGHLTSLSELVVSKNDLEVLPPSIGLLRNLHTLHADDNELVTVPPELGSCSSLAVLTLASNKLEALPPEIGHLSTLRVLNVCDNNIRNLPVSFSKLKLLALWLSDNQAKPSVQLQTETDPRSGQKVLSCYMLPQQASQRAADKTSKDEDEPFPMAGWEERHRARSIIKFSFDDTEPKTGAKLSRAPTPYPKELRALAKHARSVAANSGKVPQGEGVLGRRASHDVEVADSNRAGALGEEGKRKSAPCVLSVIAAPRQPEGAVTAQYQSAVAEQTPLGINDAVVRTANKTSPSCVMEGTSGSSDDSRPHEAEQGLVAPPIEELPPRPSEPWSIQQSKLMSESKLSPIKKNLPASASPVTEAQVIVQLSNSPPAATGLNTPSAMPPYMSERTSAPAMVTSSTVNSSTTPTVSSSISSSLNPVSVPVVNTAASSAVTSPTSPTSMSASSGTVPSTPASIPPAVSDDDDATADVLAEALALADHVADAPFKSSPGDDTADHSSTDSGYCRPSHPTSSQCDLSDQSSELVSPTPSLPSEAVSPVTTSSRHGSISRTSPVQSFSSSPAHTQQCTPNSALPSAAYSFAADPYSGQAHTATQPGLSSPSKAYSSPHHPSTSPYAAGAPTYAAHYTAVSPTRVATSPQHSSAILNTPSQYRASADKKVRTDWEVTSHNFPPAAVSNVPDSGQDAASYSPCLTSGVGQPRPGSLALSSLAESGMLSDRAGYLARPGSLAAPCNTLGIPPAPPTRAVSAATGLNHTNRLAKQDSGSSLKSPISYDQNYALPNNTGIGTEDGIHATMSASKIPDSSSMHQETIDVPLHAGSVVPHSLAGGKYSSLQTRIPINRLSSSSSITSSREGSRIPSYNSPHASKIPSDFSPKSPQFVSSEGNSYKPSLAATGRTYSNLSMKSNISAVSSTSEQHGYSNRNDGPTDPSRICIKESRIPSVVESINNSHGGRGSPISSSSSGRFFPNNPSSPPAGVSSPPYNSSSAKSTNISQYPSPPIKNTGIPPPGYTRSGSIGRVSDGGTTSSSSGESLGNTSLPVGSSYSKSSRLPLSPNSSFDSNRDYRSPLSRIPSSGYVSSGGSLSPVNEAINTSGLPPPPSGEQQPQARPSGLQPPKTYSRMPLMDGVSSATAGPPGTGRSPPPAAAPVHSSHRPSKGRAPGQASSWMFGSHQNARVFPVIVEKLPTPGFTVTLISEPEKSVIVCSVERDGPASAALHPGDKILQVDGESLAGATAEDVLAFMEPNGDTLSLLISRLH